MEKRTNKKMKSATSSSPSDFLKEEGSGG